MFYNLRMRPHQLTGNTLLKSKQLKLKNDFDFSQNKKV